MVCVFACECSYACTGSLDWCSHLKNSRKNVPVTFARGVPVHGNSWSWLDVLHIELSEATTRTGAQCCCRRPGVRARDKGAIGHGPQRCAGGARGARASAGSWQGVPSPVAHSGYAARLSSCPFFFASPLLCLACVRLGRQRLRMGPQCCASYEKSRTCLAPVLGEAGARVLCSSAAAACPLRRCGCTCVCVSWRRRDTQRSRALRCPQHRAVWGRKRKFLFGVFSRGDVFGVVNGN